VLKKAPGVRSPLATDGDYGEEQITVVDPSGFKVGGGVTIGYEHPGNFHTTVATIVAQIDDHTFAINRPLVDDYVVSRHAAAQTTFPVISGYHVEGVAVEDLTIDGNRAHNPYLGGCRGGGVFLYRSHGTRLSRLRVHDYNGDGISYQQSHDVVVEDCVVTHCADKGLHPGSGSQRTVVRRCQLLENDKIGLFVCWRVRFSRFEACTIRGNGEVGVSIGHKDTDNVFTGNEIIENGRHGVLFRNEPEHLAAHRNRFEHNRICDNGRDGEGCGIYVGGQTRDLVITGNTFANTVRPPRQRYAIFVGAEAGPLQVDGNTMEGHEAEMHRASA
ncbi:MAG TPA: right-handed parallel beta-helix repeat-containing protein, partial [Limnochordia bacterium]